MRAQPSRRSSTSTGSPCRSSVTRSASSLGSARTAATETEQRTSTRLERALGQQLSERRVLAELSDGHERVALLNDVRRLRARHGLWVAQDRDDGDPRLGPEPTLGKRLSDQRTVVGNRDPLDRQLAERELQILDDLWALVGPADHRAELARLVVVQANDRCGLVVVLVAKEVDLPHPVVVQDDRQPSALGCAKAVLDSDTGQPGFSQIDRHRYSSASLGTGISLRPIHFDSFITMTPIVAVART